jgi:hypothetical protein
MYSIIIEEHTANMDKGKNVDISYITCYTLHLRAMDVELRDSEN